LATRTAPSAEASRKLKKAVELRARIPDEQELIDLAKNVSGDSSHTGPSCRRIDVRFCMLNPS